MAKRAEELGSRRGITRPQAGEFGCGSHKNRQGPECRMVRWGDRAGLRAGGWRQPAAAPFGGRFFSSLRIFSALMGSSLIWMPIAS